MRTVALAAILVVAAGSCGSKPPAQPLASHTTWSAPAILAHVPADTPYLFAAIDPVSEQLRRRMLAGVDQQIVHVLELTKELSAGDRRQLDPWMRAGLAVLDLVRDKPVAEWQQSLGFSRDGRFAVYGIGVWPVLRIEVADPARLRGVIDHALAAANIDRSTRSFDGRAYWRLTVGKVDVVASVTDRELVATVLPARLVDSALPLVLGARPPQDSLATSRTVPDLMARHGFTGSAIGYVDTRALARVLTREPTALDAPLRDAIGPVTPACRADVDRLAAAMPRVVYGYRRFDANGFEMALVAEVPARLTRGLANARVGVPGVAVAQQRDPLFALGVAARSEAVIAWLRELAGGVRERPFACEWLGGLNSAAAWVGTFAANPLPRPLQDLEGFALVVDDMQPVPPSLSGDILLVGGHVADIIPLLNQAVPVLPGIPTADGRAIEIPTTKLGIPWVTSAHLATKGDRLAVAVGSDSDRRVVERLATTAPTRSPLAVVALDAPRLQRVLAALGSDGTSLDRMQDLGDAVMRLDVDDAGITFGMTATWRR